MIGEVSYRVDRVSPSVAARDDGRPAARGFLAARIVAPFFGIFRWVRNFVGSPNSRRFWHETAAGGCGGFCYSTDLSGISSRTLDRLHVGPLLAE
jgi:hypothetical protein